MLVGSLRQVVDIQQASETISSAGQRLISYATIATRRAKVTQLSGREAVYAKQVVAKATHKIEMRYLSGLTTKHRLKLGNRIFNIVELNNTDEANKEHVIMATEVV